MPEPSKGRASNGASSIYRGRDGDWHGRVTMGTRDDGRPDRRHVRAKTRAEVTRKVRELEKSREAGTVRRAGRAWTVEQWLTHWVENIAAPFVRPNTLAGYRVAVRVHLIPGVGAHRLDRLEPEHLERLYVRMMRNGSAAGTAHQAHRTIRTALGEAVRRGHLARNPAALAKAPDSRRRKSSRTPSRTCGASSPRRRTAGTAPDGPSRSPSVCARAKRSACSGPTSTWTPARSQSAVPASALAGNTAAPASAASRRPATVRTGSPPVRTRPKRSPATAAA
jgi:Phage integrase, N-terminal SAM-like domain